jgi:hypothetical protein
MKVMEACCAMPNNSYNGNIFLLLRVTRLILYAAKPQKIIPYRKLAFRENFSL